MLTVLTLAVTLPCCAGAQTVTQNAQALNIGFNGSDTSGSDNQLPYSDQFYTATRAFYATLGRQMPGNRHCTPMSPGTSLSNRPDREAQVSRARSSGSRPGSQTARATAMKL